MSFTAVFDYNEAMVTLKLSYLVDAYGGVAKLNLPSTSDPIGPVADSTAAWNGTGTPPSPMVASLRPICPSNLAGKPGPNWVNCLSVSTPPKNSAVADNVAMLSLLPDNTYAIAFRGTSNVANIKQDLLAEMVTAGPIKHNVLHKDSDFYYVPSGDKDSKVHSGFRSSFESLFNPGRMFQNSQTLDKLINLIPDGANVFITGHSLGAGQATLCAAALAVGGIPNVTKRFKIKMYAHAQPAPGNTAFANAFQNALGAGMGYCINNDLDPVPTAPDLLSKAYVPVGVQVPLKGTSVTFAPAPDNNGNKDYYFPSTPYVYYTVTPSTTPQPTLLQSGLFSDLNKPGLQVQIIQDMWQHWPWVYAAMMQAQLPHS